MTRECAPDEIAREIAIARSSRSRVTAIARAMYERRAPREDRARHAGKSIDRSRSIDLGRSVGRARARAADETWTRVMATRARRADVRSRLRARAGDAGDGRERERALARAIARAGATSVGRTVDRATRRATRRVARELASAVDVGQGVDRALIELARALGECASKAALPRRVDDVVAALRAVTRCGEDFARAMVPESTWALVDGVDGLGLARQNARVAAAYVEAVASASGGGDARAVEAVRALGRVNAFEHVDRPTIFGVMEVFQDLASSERSNAVEACLEKSGALRDFIADGFVTLAAREHDEALDEAMARRFFAFVLAILRSKSERFAAMAFSGVEAAAAPVVSRMCLSRAGTEPNALTLYREITQRAMREGERAME